MARRRSGARQVVGAHMGSPSAEIATTNAFSALSETTDDQPQAHEHEQEERTTHELPDHKLAPASTWTAEPLALRSWADYYYDDDDDFFANVPPLSTPPPLAIASPPKRTPTPPPALEAIPEEDEEEIEEEETTAPIMPSVRPVQKPAFNSKQALAKNDSPVAQFAMTRAWTSKQQQEKSRFKEEEGRSGCSTRTPAPQPAPSQKRRGNARNMRSKAIMKEKPSCAAEEALHAQTAKMVQESVDHKLRLGALTWAKGDQQGRGAVNGLPCKAAAAATVAEAGACSWVPKVAPTKKKETSKEQNRYILAR